MSREFLVAGLRIGGMKDGVWKYWMMREAVIADDRSFMPFVLLFNDMVDMTVPCSANRWGIYTFNEFKVDMYRYMQILL
jgi:hypothetical protein